MKTTPEHISTLQPNEIFVFGSNEAGIHGAGAAYIARKKFGAKWGQGLGLQGQSYALPTKNHDIHTLPLSEIEKYVNIFLRFAQQHPQFEFLVTKIGCGHAGYTEAEIAPLFKGKVIPDNVALPVEFQ